MLTRMLCCRLSARERRKMEKKLAKRAASKQQEAARTRKQEKQDVRHFCRCCSGAHCFRSHTFQAYRAKQAARDEEYRKKV